MRPNAIAITSSKTAVALPQMEMPSVTWPATAIQVRYAEGQTDWTCTAILEAPLQVQHQLRLRAPPQPQLRRPQLPPGPALQPVYRQHGPTEAGKLTQFSFMASSYFIGYSGPEIRNNKIGSRADGPCSYIDSTNGRILIQQAGSSTLTIESCVQTCIGLGYSVAGVEYSTQCFCGDYIFNGGSLASEDSDCDMTCGGNSTEICGGPNRMSIYANGTLTTYAAPTIQNTSLPGEWQYQGCLT